MPRLILVSNRLPVTVTQENGELKISPSAGGLATGLRGPHEQMDGLWFGYPGDVSGLPPPRLQELERHLADLRAVPVHLSAADVRHYYDGFSNGVLWPLFHYLLDRIPLRARAWDAYVRVNERFADVVASRYQPGDLIWVHDYQLMLLPALLRRRLPEATIGFFLHIPFPSYELFRLLPWREEILRGLLGADVIGFHTASYLRHFATSLLRLLGFEVDVARLFYQGRRIKLRVFPMGVDAAAFARLAASPEVAADAEALRAQHSGARLLLGVDRLDYTKGIPRRLLALERLLERQPALCGQVRLLQVAVPTRDKVEEYQSFRGQVEGLVGRINGSYSTLGMAPIHYLHQSVSDRQLAAMYRAADVMVVTPLRDGMNLVAKEYVACRVDEDGVLVLSELAGAASQLAEALQVNPYDVDGLAETLARALRLPPAERRWRMRRLREGVQQEDVHHWARTFIEILERSQAQRLSAAARLLRPEALLEQVLEELKSGRRLVLLLDYDGTLVPLAARPEEAVPDDELLALLRGLGEHPSIEVHIISGRPRRDLERWLAGLPLGLHAEHGMASRWLGEAEWTTQRVDDVSWKDRVRPILEEFAATTPGAFVEEKEISLVWHYRLSDREFGAAQSKELRLHLMEMLSNLPVQILGGAKNVEVRAQGVHKGVVVKALQERLPDTSLLAIGDDRTDEDLFALLPPGAFSVCVGSADTRARFRLEDPAACRVLLQGLLGWSSGT